MSRETVYGWWPLVLLNSAVFILFAFSFTRPQRGREWRSLGAFSAFDAGEMLRQPRQQQVDRNTPKCGLLRQPNMASSRCPASCERKSR
jgi:hypothetical protein